jgi:hypothetical protein
VDAHQDLPSDGHEVAAMAITNGDRIRWSSRREICSDRRLRAAGGDVGSAGRIHADYLLLCVVTRVAARRRRYLASWRDHPVGLAVRGMVVGWREALVGVAAMVGARK